MNVRFLIKVGLVERIEQARPERASNQHFSGIELFGEALNNETCLRPFVIGLPESRRTSSVDSIVAVMKRNNAQSTGVKNVTVQYSRAAAYQYIKIQRLYFFNILGRESIHETRFGNDGA